MAEIIAIEVSDEEVAYLVEKYSESEVTAESHTLNRLAKKLWGALPAGAAVEAKP